MLFIPNDSYDPYFNLACEEYVLKNLAGVEPCFLLWQNKPTIVVGRFQNTQAEINFEFVQKRKVNVVRRNTGGGAVYHDLGNLNFTFIQQSEQRKLDFRRFTLPIVKALNAMGVPAELSGRNDLTIKGKKFSGNSQYHYKGKIMHHGTLLFNSNLDDVAEALLVSPEKFESKGVKSVRGRVTNISEYLNLEFTIAQFKAILLEYLFAGREIKKYNLNAEDLKKIENLRQEKYLTWEWNYGHSPGFDFRQKKRFPCGEIEVGLVIKAGKIKECKFYGDFFSNEDLTILEKGLVGLKYQEGEIEAFFQKINLEKYFERVEWKELSHLFFP